MIFKLYELFYIPNIIEYVRIYLLFLALNTNNFNYFLLNFFLDIIDGQIARYLKQTSDLGCFLDHFIDRLTITMPSLHILYFRNFDIFLLFVIIESITNILNNYVLNNKHMIHIKHDNYILKYYYSNNRLNILSMCSLIPYFLYPTVIYSFGYNIQLITLIMLRFGVFLYFLIYLQKLKQWNILINKRIL